MKDIPKYYQSYFFSVKQNQILQWYFVTKIVLTYCEKKIVLLIENFFEIITKTICSNSERSEQFLVTKCVFNLFLEVSQYNKLEQLKLKKYQKVRKNKFYKLFFLF